MEKYLEWTTLTHEYYDRSADWFWAVGAVLGVILAFSAYFHNLLLIIIILVGGGLLFYFALTPPQEISCAVTDKGLIIHNEIFLFNNIASFWLFEESHRRKMVIQTKRYILPHIIIPLGDVEPAAVRSILKKYLPEVEYKLTISDLIHEYLGF